LKVRPLLPGSRVPRPWPFAGPWDVADWTGRWFSRGTRTATGQPPRAGDDRTSATDEDAVRWSAPNAGLRHRPLRRHLDVPAGAP